MPLSGSPNEQVRQEMHKFKHGTLHSGSKRGPKVRSRRQAVAIALNEAGLSRKSKRGRRSMRRGRR
jgi:hypothetical protein